MGKLSKGRWLAIVLALAMVFTVMPMMGVGAVNNDCEPYDPEGMTLYADQDTKVGTVYVENDDENLYVEYELDEDAIDEGWCITETHVHVEKEHDDFPLAGRHDNPVPGQFDYSEDHDPCVTEYKYEIPLDEWEAGHDLKIAAHAAIEREEIIEHEKTILSDTSTEYYDEEEEWIDSVKTWVHPSWVAVDEDAVWIWESFYVENPEIDEFVDFRKIFDIEGEPTSGNLTITVDNTFNAELNKNEFSDSDGKWETIDNFDITDWLVAGENTLFIYAQNNAGSSDPEENPAGVNYKMDIESEETIVYEETAWADGTRFTDKGNWATYFCYTVVDPETCDTDVVAGADIPDYPEIDAEDFDIAVDEDDEYGGYDHWDSEHTTIEEAIGVADEEDSILVFAGTYEGALSIDVEGLTLVSKEGPEETIIDADGIDRAIDIHADNVRVEGFTVQNFGEMAFNAASDGFEIVHNIVPEGEGDHGAAAYAVYIWGANGGLVENNDLGTQPLPQNDTTRTISVLDSENIDIINNEITHKEIESAVVGSEIAIDNSSDITVEGNTVEGFDGSIAIAVSGFFGPTSDVFILNNEIKNNVIGVRVGIPGVDDTITGVQVNQNNIVGNEDFGVAHYHGDEVDATCNWWGTDDGDEIEDMVTGDVEYEPWLTEALETR